VSDRQQPHSAAIFQDLVGKGVQRRFGISGVELGDDHHTLPLLVFIAPTPEFGPLLHPERRELMAFIR
jgi:hypothetical protein